jgi:hypothetical protein
MSDPGASAAFDATSGGGPEGEPDEERDEPSGEPGGQPSDELSDEAVDKAVDQAANEEGDEGPEPSWWHRSHPTFAGLVGFFCGVAYVIVVPGVYAAVLGLLFGDSTAQELFPLVLVALLIPLVLLVPRRTRRFAEFAFLGIFSTILVVAVTSALVIWVMVKFVG